MLDASSLLFIYTFLLNLIYRLVSFLVSSYVPYYSYSLPQPLSFTSFFTSIMFSPSLYGISASHHLSLLLPFLPYIVLFPFFFLCQLFVLSSPLLYLGSLFALLSSSAHASAVLSSRACLAGRFIFIGFFSFFSESNNDRIGSIFAHIFLYFLALFATFSCLSFPPAPSPLTPFSPPPLSLPSPN